MRDLKKKQSNSKLYKDAGSLQIHSFKRPWITIFLPFWIFSTYCGPANSALKLIQSLGKASILPWFWCGIFTQFNFRKYIAQIYGFGPILYLPVLHHSRVIQRLVKKECDDTKILEFLWQTHNHMTRDFQRIKKSERLGHFLLDLFHGLKLWASELPDQTEKL